MQSEKKVLIIEKIYGGAIDFLKDCGYEVLCGENQEYETILRQIKDCEGAIVRSAPRITNEMFSAAQKLKVIGRWGVGLDHIDIDAAAARGIYVVFTPAANNISVAEHAIALFMALAKRLKECDRQTRAGNWAFRMDNLAREVDGMTAGIIGYGRIGREIGKKLHYAFNMKILIYDPYIKNVESYCKITELDELYHESDLVTVHMPNTPETTKMVDGTAFGKMKNSAIFINVSRGANVDEKALCDALKNRRIYGAGIDVFEQEPAAADNPLFRLDNILVSPHYAGANVECTQRMAMHVAQGVHEVLSGHKPSWPANNPIVK
ncbi:MAG: hydroxyacid dehydrogenase [Acidaminococcales bacterium]|nr:hydroxyacid dehydrogenase [Acidaminococcales bacterium]